MYIHMPLKKHMMGPSESMGSFAAPGCSYGEMRMYITGTYRAFAALLFIALRNEATLMRDDTT